MHHIVPLHLFVLLCFYEENDNEVLNDLSSRKMNETFHREKSGPNVPMSFF
jgi:hypothetical protein